ncbi:divergent polysaccharide deacetylase family protein [Halanaerobacter jeridensis]|uniref:Peptidoglycan/xylan/chitin deacetylase (PgdA/CDA1 family) n=1 Tax=Halanaerobacter jeridensis TaxID=706427 RepID=A0A938XUT8_9FIRM|nr:divergent polysaccharide deacetylase family protein [Halanaerobacter jeridensis]MBM7557920.1 peptidoglycan/xylan/chitin deacetylase (PgdA/CDA1 family) [Halanaerobacter jeridensis]
MAHKIGYKTIMWTVDTIDWQRPEPEVIVERVVPKAENGAIVLMHPTKATVEALPKMIAGLKDKGYKLVTISQLLSE